MTFEADYYRSVKFSCGNKKCDGMLVPIQVRKDRKDEEAIITGKCPDCGKSYKFPLSLDQEEIRKWQPLLEDLMNTCSKCGEENSLKLLESEGNPKSEYTVKVECLECGKREKRFIDGELYFLLEKDMPSADRMVISCPTCGETVNDEEQVCPNCHREIFCDACGGLLSSMAKFCVKCGDPVDLGDPTKKQISLSSEQATVCPNCGAVLTSKHKFCNECGQEIICTQCGELLAPGAVFCNSCGDKVKMGKK
ncbi:hypothetical protein GF325_14680 [Candidatus Bathyarchaeota archaeon]|nr:hypothetical protein [Candidatus Bathyarchaeota archaeon]